MGLIRCMNGHLFSEKKNGNICPYCNVVVNKNASAGEDPLGKYSDTTYLGDLEVLKPVTGWLTCLEGPSKGRDYRIVAEKNFVGRSGEMDIRILGDDTISPRNHVTIVYDPEKNRTMLLPGDSQGLAYILDDEDRWDAVYGPRELEAGDRLKIGQSIFLFVPLCGENSGFVFNWKDEQK